MHEGEVMSCYSCSCGKEAHRVSFFLSCISCAANTSHQLRLDEACYGMNWILPHKTYVWHCKNACTYTLYAHTYVLKHSCTHVLIIHTYVHSYIRMYVWTSADKGLCAWNTFACCTVFLLQSPWSLPSQDVPKGTQSVPSLCVDASFMWRERNTLYKHSIKG